MSNVAILEKSVDMDILDVGTFSLLERTEKTVNLLVEDTVDYLAAKNADSVFAGVLLVGGEWIRDIVRDRFLDKEKFKERGYSVFKPSDLPDLPKNEILPNGKKVLSIDLGYWFDEGVIRKVERCYRGIEHIEERTVFYDPPKREEDSSSVRCA